MFIPLRIILVTPNISRMRLFHISEEADIELFSPRPTTRSDLKGKRYVWAITEEKLPHYLLPRDCPRVIFFEGPQTSPEDAQRFLAGTDHHKIMAIEAGWLPRIEQTRLFVYELDPQNFELNDAAAGYYVSEQEEWPLGVERVDDIWAALRQYPLDVRVFSNLWGLRHAIVQSSLDFSIIRMRNAQPPSGGHHPGP